LEKSADEKTFEQYRESLKGEAMRLACFIRVYRLLQERRGDRLAELNVAPCFFQTVEDALFSAIVLWIDKLLAEGAERGLHNFLKFVENHRPLFSIERFQRRRGLPDGDWRLERAPVDYAMVAADRERIINFEPLTSFRLRRDKFHAHFDKRYFFDRRRIAEEAPLKWSDLGEAMELLKDILNRYSSAYDGVVFHIEPFNANDLNYLLDCLRKIRNERDGE
jgi:HEPN superfamily AbiU2-like protein